MLRSGRDSQGALFDHAINKAVAPADYFEFEDRFGAILAGRSIAEIQAIDGCVRGGACPAIPEADEMETLQSWLAAASAEDRANHESAADVMLQGVSGSAGVEETTANEEVDVAAGEATLDDSEKEMLDVPAVSGDAGSAAGALGTSLFCFMIVLADSGDPGLQEVAQSRHAGIFDCDSNAVYPGVRTSTYDTPEGQFAANAELFANIWKQFGADGLYKNYDWTVKADPDTVFIPQRLRERLQGLGVNANEAVYVKNTGLVPWGFLGPIEVLSKAAVDQLTARIASDCRAGVSEGEDGWLNDCLENKIGIPARVDTNLLYSGCQIDACGDATFVAFHFYKDPGSWGSCLDRMR